MNRPGNKIAFVSLGCPRNLVDTEVMLGILLKNGYEPAEELSDADAIVINTCGFLESARKESVDSINGAIVERKSGARVIATGCMVQSHQEKIKDACPGVDAFLGSGDVEGILKAVQADTPFDQVTTARSYLEAGEVPRRTSTPDHFAYLKIAEGCRKRCAYCIIPDIKGPLKSKPIDRVVHEFRVLRSQGVKEIILIAQDLGDWGRDIGHKKGEGLVTLLTELLKEEGDYWLRLLYVYPDEITESLINLMQSDSRICPYLDMPIQHINDTILRSMRRATNGEQIRTTINRVREALPGVAIRTSLIVGYPGETEEQFQQLLDFVEEARLDNVGVFPYSVEAGSHAASLPDQVAEETKQERHAILMETQQQIVKENNQKIIGTTLEVVIEGYHPESELLMEGRHQGQCPDIDGTVIINDPTGVHAFGERYFVEITGVSGYDLVGRAVAAVRSPLAVI
jgi:ribosomal protein S12 methylthiotransferase